MLGGIISGLIVAWILSLFNVDVILINAIQPFISSVQLTNAHYYTLFALIGLIGVLIEQKRR